MITQFKIFENWGDQFTEGAFVIAHSLYRTKELKNFLENNVGKLYWIEKVQGVNKIFYNVEYDYVPNELKHLFRHIGTPNNGAKLRRTYMYAFTFGEIRLATPEEIKLQKVKDDANKYNL